MTPTEWRAAAAHVTELLDAPWRFGDWCLAAERLDLIDERTTILLADRRWEGTELAACTFVAERFPPPRRRPLPWSYHDAVARLPPAAADDLLDLAAMESWTLQELRRAARTMTRELTR